MCLPVRPPSGCSRRRKAWCRVRGSSSQRKTNMARSRRPRSLGRLNRLLLLAAIILQAIPAEAKTPGPIALQLEVFIDGNPTHKITGFELLPDGRLSAKRADLLGLGMPVPGDGDIVVL